MLVKVFFFLSSGIWKGGRLHASSLRDLTALVCDFDYGGSFSPNMVNNGAT